MSASSLITLGPAAFRTLITAARLALHPPCVAPVCLPPRPPSCSGRQPCDEGNCRTLLNEAEREIDRLRRQVDRIELCSPFLPRPESCHSNVQECDYSNDLASPMQRRRTYAVAPIGDMSVIAHLSPIATPAPWLQRVPMVTNLGTRLDVLM